MNKIQVGTGLAVMLMAAAGWAGEKEIKQDQIPAPVLVSVKNICPGGVLKKAVMEKEDGTVVYELEMVVNEKDCDIKTAADGSVLEIEQQVAVESLPVVVKNAAAVFDHVVIEKAEKVQEGKTVFYELDLSVNGQKMEVKISEQGKITDVEKKCKKGDKDEDENDDDENDDDED